MKDWRRSPELPSMMGTAVLNHGDQYGAEHDRHTQIVKEQQAVASTSRSKLDLSLAEMARRTIIQRIHLYDTFGDAPFQLVRPILEQCQPKKLWILEENSPQYIRETNYIWKRHCQREFRDLGKEQTDLARKSIGGWREVYRLKMIEDKEARDAATQRAKERYASLKADKQASRVQVVNELPSAKRQKGLHGRFPGGAGAPASTTTTTTSMSQGQRMLHKARRQSQINSLATRSAVPPGGRTSFIVPNPSAGRTGQSSNLSSGAVGARPTASRQSGLPKR